MVCSEGRNQLSTIQPYYNFVSAAPMTDSRKGCPYDVRSLNFVRIFKRRTKFAPTVCKKRFSEDFMPLSRQRCVEVAAPYKIRDNKSLQISRANNIRPHCICFIYCFEQNKTNPSVYASRIQLSYRGAKIDSATSPNLLLRIIALYIQKVPADTTVGTETVYKHLLGTIRIFQFIPALPTASKSR